MVIISSVVNGEVSTESRADSSVNVIEIPRSAAWADLPSNNALRVGSLIVSETRSTSRCERARSAVARSAARSEWPVSISATIVCSRLADSCACDRSASAKRESESNSPMAADNSVLSRIVTTVEPGRVDTGARLTTSTRP
ncbi:Uncharacterised protein [Mycobacteroides abscessus subsp. abscessus]|nr:Uncharacterised protein [Mycobacteroides abscessus subsp. abscessus]